MLIVTKVIKLLLRDRTDNNASGQIGYNFIQEILFKIVGSLKKVFQVLDPNA